MYVLFWMAIIWTCLGFAAICVIDKVVTLTKSETGIRVSGLNSLADAWILLIGLSWEKSFIKALEGLQSGKAVMQLSRVGLLVFVIPAWLFYMLPRTPRMQGHGHGHGHEEHHHGEHHGHGGEHAVEGEEHLHEHNEYGEHAEGEPHHGGAEHVEDNYAAAAYEQEASGSYYDEYGRIRSSQDGR